MNKTMRLLIICGIVSIVLGACQSEGAATTPAVAAPITALPSASNTSRTEVSSIPNLPTLELQPSLTPTPGPLLLPAPYMPSTFTGAVPLGAVARLGQG